MSGDETWDKLDIRDGVIHYRLYQQDGTLTPMTCRDTVSNRWFVAWVQQHDRYTATPSPPETKERG